MFDDTFGFPWGDVLGIVFTSAVSYGSYAAGKKAGIREMTEQQRDQEILMLRRELEKLRSTQAISQDPM